MYIDSQQYCIQLNRIGSNRFVTSVNRIESNRELSVLFRPYFQYCYHVHELVIYYLLFYFQVHRLTDEELKKRKVVYIDIANDKVSDYKEEWDPTKFKSQKTGRGPIEGADWTVSFADLQ